MRLTDNPRQAVLQWLLVGCALALTNPLRGDEPAADPSEAAAAETAQPVVKPAEQLADRQSQVADQFQRLEMLMLKMAEFDAGTNPQRSALLKQALTRSKDNQVSQQMLELVKLLRQEELKRAHDEQVEVRDQLAQILELLLNENRADRLKQEQNRVQAYIKEVERILRQQRGVQGRTEGGDDEQRLAQEQGNIGDRTERLAKEIDDNERPHTESTDGTAPQNESAPSEPQPGESKPSEPEAGKSMPDEPTPGQSTPTEPTPGEPSPGEPSPGAPSPGAPSPEAPAAPEESQPPPQSFPGQQQLQQALEQMRQAQQRLQQAQRSEAIPAQQEARRLLEEAKAELEEILRQMREEEIERALAQLEARFRKMLEMQIKVYEETQQLSELSGDDRASQLIVQAGKLSGDEGRILQEADKALLLLREEGSSVAFPEAVEQMREDMVLVVDRLSQAKVDLLTTGLEEDIIAAIEEIVQALQKAQQDAEQRRQRPQPPQQPMSPEDLPLVDAIAELKMIRALQMRVNQRTDTYAKMLADPEHVVGQATDQDLLESLDQLSQREQRIHQITRDILLERNQ